VPHHSSALRKCSRRRVSPPVHRYGVYHRDAPEMAVNGKCSRRRVSPPVHRYGVYHRDAPEMAVNGKPSYTQQVRAT